MEISVRAAKRNGSTKHIFNRQLDIEDLCRVADEAIGISIAANDIYSKGAQQRYTIVLSHDDITLLARAFTA